MANSKSIRVLVVGQTPPPYGGQAVMIETLLRGDYGDDVTLHHVPMRFSRHMGEIGRFKIRKVIELLGLLRHLFILQMLKRFDGLYYPPASSTWSGVLRDLIVLNLVRPLFPNVIFHFHAGGLGEFVSGELPKLLRPLARRAYFYPDIAIQLSEHSPPDALFVHARTAVYVPNGVQDVYSSYYRLGSSDTTVSSRPIILFVGGLYQSKGVLILLEAAKRLKEIGSQFEVHLMGEGSREAEDQILQYLIQEDLADEVRMLGVLIEEDKWATFAGADICCHPSYDDNLPVVIVEAMMFALPVVATSWRGIPTLVRDGENGFLVPIKDPEALADRLAVLLENSELRKKMGQRGRARFVEEFTVGTFWEKMRQVFEMMASAVGEGE